MNLGRDLFRASAAGSLMLMGEHAVLRNKPALAFAIDKRITVSLTPRRDDQVFIRSDLGEYSSTLSDLSVQAPFTFVLAAIEACRSEFSHGFELSIESQFSDKMGWGSSAAVVVATLKSFEGLLGRVWSEETLFHSAKMVVQQVQGLGSGSDVAASVYGGLVFYQPFSNRIDKINVFPPFLVFYSGYKTPTVEVIQQVEQRRSQYPVLFDHLFDTLAACTLQGRFALEKEDWPRLGELMNIHQGLQMALGVSTLALEQLIDELRKNPRIYGAKISGAGLGDCVIGLGDLGSTTLDPISLQISREGVLSE